MLGFVLGSKFVGVRVIYGELSEGVFTRGYRYGFG